MEINALMKKSLWVGLALVLAAMVGAFVWLFSGHKVALFEGLSAESLVEYSAKLESKGLSYQVDAATGSIWVDVADANQARVLALGDRVKQSSSTGLELYGNTDFSATEYAHQANYTRALQGEIERTLSAIHYIKAARVHLSLPAKKLFGPAQQAKASVTLFLADHYQPAPAQIQGIRQIVSSAVEGLSESQVVVLSSDGQYQDGQSVTAETAVLSVQKATERYLADKVYQVLQPVLSAQQVSVSVLAELAVDKVKTAETKPVTVDQRNALIAKESVQQDSRPAALNAQASQSERRDVDYVHGTITTETEQAIGTIERLSVAVTVNADLDAASRSQIESLINATLGINPRRGDQLSVRFFAMKPALSPAVQQPTLVDAPAAVVASTPSTASTAAVSSSNAQLRWSWQSVGWGLAGVALLLAGAGGWLRLQRRRDQQLVQQIQGLFQHDGA